MRKQIRINKLCALCFGVVTAALVLLLADVTVVFLGGMLSVPKAAVLMAAMTLIFYFSWRKYGKQTASGLCIVLVLTAVLATVGFGCWSSFSRNAHYQYPDSGKKAFYGDRRVMLVVPHQDDDLNILSGVMEEYVRYGSSLYGVFITNGDYAGLAEERYREALAVFNSAGVPGDHVIFLGYGDGWQEGGPHIYNAEPGSVMTSYHGRTETYGAADHAAYRDGRAYTSENLMEDLEAVILEYQPDVLFCSDYDHHIDHKATTLYFDKVMGKILKENPQYHPVVYKAYAYGTAWEAEPDFYADTVRSTQDLFAEPYAQQPAVYRWEERVRFPVDGAMLSRSLVGSRAYAQLALYESQGAWQQAARVINGDKVAWERRTDSLCLSADIASSSGNSKVLHDFMLLENHDLTDEYRMPYDGVWIPETTDPDKTAEIVLSESSDICTIVLYDHPSITENVLNARISFADGSEVQTGPLDPGGAATVIAVDRMNVKSFSVSLLETEGEQAGLSEIEAFAQVHQRDGSFLKLMDTDGNFLYEYWVPEDGQAELSLYTWGDLPEVTQEHYTVDTSWEKGSAVLENGGIRVFCPAGETFVLNVTCPSFGVSDNILIRNPGRLERLWTALWQSVEEAVYTRLSNGDYKKLLIFSVSEKISHVLRHL